MENNEQDNSLEGTPVAPSQTFGPTPAGNEAPTTSGPVVTGPTVSGPVPPAGASPSAPTGAPGVAPPPAPPPQKPSLIQRLVARINVYTLLFVLLLAVAAGVIALTYKTSKNNPSSANSPNVASLTNSQIASLKGSTTTVGSSKQILDVQSSAIFENQILARSDVDVAGNLKVGGNLNLPSLNVTGATTLSSLTVGNALNVAGALDVQGQLTLHKGLSVAGTTSFGALSASTLSVTTLQLSGDLSLNRHIVTSGNTPGRSAGTALGGGGTASVSGNDTAGTVNINTGSSPAAGCFITVSFVHTFSSTPSVIITPVGSSAGGLDYYVNRSTSSFSVCSTSVPSAGKSFGFDYLVIQ